MTIYDVMRDGAVLLAVHEKHEHIVSWDRDCTMCLWIETEGQFELLETRHYPGKPTLQDALASATRMILNVDEQARIILHEVQSLTLPRRQR